MGRWRLVPALAVPTGVSPGKTLVKWRERMRCVAMRRKGTPRQPRLKSGAGDLGMTQI